jgi:hypothetical protein
MTPRSRLLTLWLVVGTVAALIAVPLAGPMRVAWQCYWLHENGVREQAEVLHKLETATFALLITEGPHAGEACTADTSLAIFDATELGDVLEVVRLDSRPGECELSSTIEASAQLLWIISGGFGFATGGSSASRSGCRTRWAGCPGRWAGVGALVCTPSAACRARSSCSSTGI